MTRSGADLRREAGTGVAAVIPVRYTATRFPGKPLAEIHGRPLVEWVYRRAVRIRGVDQVWVATDDDRIEDACQRFGASVVRTRTDHASGTDRIGEVLAKLDPRPRFVLNLQGDEPLLPVRAVEQLLAEEARHPETILTLVEPVRDTAEWLRPSVVKAVVSTGGRVLYFSRAPIPHPRDPKETHGVRWRHLGIYGYPADVLTRIVALPTSPLERVEGLEQLRWMESGVPIHALVAEAGSPGVDLPEDLQRLRERYPTLAAWEAVP